MRAPDFWCKSDALSRAKAFLLTPIGWIYGFSVAWKFRHTRRYRTRAKVICVGNLTAGGTGKTPVAIALAETLQRRGHRIAFLSRGYGGRLTGPVIVDPARHSAAEVGDEPLMLAEKAVTVVARNRAAGGKLCDAQDADIIIMDDGYQNFALEKDLSIIVVDAKAGFGNGFVIPAGPLREPICQGLSRADAVVLVGQGEINLRGFSGSTFQTSLKPSGEKQAVPVIAFAGIGRPEKFFATLREIELDLRETRAFEDHHIYSDQEIIDLRETASALGAGLITTRKDFVRLPHKHRKGIDVLDVEAVFEDADALNNVLAKVE